MTFLPIVERELRVAARKRNTFWLRIVAALVALTIASGFMVLAMAVPYGMTQMGSVLFGVLTWMSLAAALGAGLFFTSDCVSEEKREGTLGFLFLTDLRGYDVVLGKLLATSLRCFFALLAIFPILAITMLMGGVTAPQFWKTVLALVNALFFSLAVGLFVSAISRDSQKALGATLLLLLLLNLGGPIVDGIVAGVSDRSFKPVLSLGSPAFVFSWVDRWTETFWTGLLTTQLLAWSLLALACALVPRTWQQRQKKRTVSHGNWSYTWRYGGSKRRVSLRQKLLSRSPVLWLACRERWQSVIVWGITMVQGASFMFCLWLDLPMGGWFLANYVGGALSLILYLGAASQASRFLVDARRSGLIELLLAAPLNGREIVGGQWIALLRMFALPMALFLCFQFAATVLSQQMMWSNVGGAGGASDWVDVVMSSAAGLMGVLVTAANLIALCWFGMWMGMTSKNANFATLKTLAFVQVIPWFGIAFASYLVSAIVLMPAIMKSATATGTSTMITNRIALYPLLVATTAAVLALAKDALFITLARRKLHSQFREMAVRVVAPIHLPTPMPPPMVGQPGSSGFLKS